MPGLELYKTDLGANVLKGLKSELGGEVSQIRYQKGATVLLLSMEGVKNAGGTPRASRTWSGRWSIRRAARPRRSSPRITERAWWARAGRRRTARAVPTCRTSSTTRSTICSKSCNRWCRRRSPSTSRSAGVAVFLGVAAATSISVAGAVVGAAGATRSLAQIAKQVSALTEPVSKTLQDVEAKRKRLQAIVRSKSLEVETLKELGRTVLSKAMVIEVAGLLETVAGLESDFKVLATKIKGVKLELVKIGQNVQTLTRVGDTIKLELRALRSAAADADVVKQVMHARKIIGVEDELKRTEKELMGLLNYTDMLTKQISTFETERQKKEDFVKQMGSKYSKSVVTYGSIAAELVQTAALFVAGDWTSPHEVITNLHNHAERVHEIVALTESSMDASKEFAGGLEEGRRAVAKDLGL